MPPKSKFMDVLDVLSSDSDSDSEGAPSESGPGGQPGPSAATASKTAGSAGGEVLSEEAGDDLGIPAAAKRRKGEVTLEQLQRAGYHSGPSVLLVKPPSEQEQVDWQWGSGREAKELEVGEESVEERRRNVEAVTVRIEESAEFSRKAVEQAELLRQHAREEKAKLAADKRLTFQQKEKRKRDAGKASKGKNFVEEEKRMAREFKMYSGFD